MTSRRFYKNNFGYAFKSGFGANISTAFIQLFIISILFVVVPSKFILSSSNIENLKNLSFFLTGDMNIFYIPLIFGVVLSSVLTGIFTFSFISDKKKVNIYYSLGIKREKLFAARFLSGFSLLVCSVFIPLIYDFILNISKFGKSKNLVGSFMFYLLGLTALSILSYSVSAFVFTNVGTVFEGIFFSATLMLLPEIFFDITNLFVKRLAFGTAYGKWTKDKILSVADSAANFNPLRFLIKGLKSSAQADKKGHVILTQYGFGEKTASQPEMFKVASIKFVLMFLVISALIFLISLYLFKRRKTEIAGFIGKSKVFNFISTFIISLSSFGITFSILINQYKFFDKWFIVSLISSIVFIITYIVVSLIIYRSGKAFIKNLYNLGIQLLICLVMLTFFKTGFFGYMYKTPNIKNIESASISNDYKNYAFNVDSSSFGITNLLLGGTMEKSGAVGEYKTEKDLKKIIEIHSSLIDNRKISTKMLKTDSEKLFPSYVEISYTLKNGKKIHRRYFGITPEQRAMLLSIEDSDYIRERLDNVFNKSYDKSLIDRSQEDFGKLNEKERASLPFEKYKKYLQDNSYMVKAFDKCMNETGLDLTDSDRIELLKALYKDITALSAKELYFPEKTLGMLQFTKNEKLWDELSVKEYEGNMYDNFEDFGRRAYPEIIISEKMTNTLEFFKLKGIDVFSKSVELPKEIKLIKLRGLDSKLYIRRGLYNGTNDIISREFVYAEADASSEGTENKDNNSRFSDEKITDANNIKTVIEQEKLFADISIENGYILNYKNRDGKQVYAYVDGRGLPDDIKSHIATIDDSKMYF